MLRALAERLSRGRVLRRRLPARFGGQPLYVSPDASLRFWRPGLSRTDPELLGWVDELVEPGAAIWDVGANVGLFAFAAAHRAGPDGSVLAVEADEWLSSLLHRSAAAGAAPTAPVEVLTAAVAEKLGVAEFRIARRGRAGSHLASVPGSGETGGARASRRVITVTLDWLLGYFPPPRLLKIDVEGAEAACLSGASRVLAEVRPTILCEVHEPNTERVAELLRDHRYEMFDAALPAARREPLERPTWNTLAVPEAGATAGPSTAGQAER